MAVKKEIDKNIEDIKKILKGKKIVFGTKVSVKMLRSGNLAKIYLSSNAPAELCGDVEQYAKLSGTEVVRLNYPNSELGALCKRPYSVSVIGVRK
jgi:large subunit ribosomal protein L30e